MTFESLIGPAGGIMHDEGSGKTLYVWTVAAEVPYARCDDKLGKNHTPSIVSHEGNFRHTPLTCPLAPGQKHRTQHFQARLTEVSLHAFTQAVETKLELTK